MKPPCCFSSSIALYTVKIYRKHKKVRLTNALIRQSAQETGEMRAICAQ